MAKNLVIVESPAKAKTIENFLGKDFKVASSFGHIADLPSKELGIDVDGDFDPKYVVSSDKKAIVKNLKKLAKNAEIVWLASDEDREGEAIAWHLQETLKLDKSKTKRIVFNSITKTAVTTAIKNPREIDYNLVNAQQARRVLDRIVGYGLSPVLWRKVKAGLSAGRVQSVSVRLIVERERSIESFKTEASYKVIAEFTTSEGKKFKAKLPKDFKTKKEAQTFLDTNKGADFKVASLTQKPAKKSPAAPFTTSTLQQEASRKLYFSVSKTMQVAQRLYEQGLITYMRTDSVNLSKEALEAAAAEIENSYGKNYVQTRSFSNKNKGAQEAHEAVRPTDMSKHTVHVERDQVRLYELIWKRTLASQMSDAQLERTNVKIEASTHKNLFTANGQMIKFDGFLKVYLEGNDNEEEENEDMLPVMSKGDFVNNNYITATERFSRAPYRFTEASLVKRLEELGIGRPSTYAPTISTIQNRKYVEKGQVEGTERKYNQLILENNTIKDKILSEKVGADKGKLIPTDIGMIVNDFLVANFENVLDYNFTANVEKQFDLIAAGKEDWKKMMKNFYKEFHPKVLDVQENAERGNGERVLGVHPETGRQVSVRLGRFGAMVQVGVVDDEEKPLFASLTANQSLTTITFEEAMDLFKLPKDLGTYEDDEVIVSNGRFGPYVKWGTKYISLEKGENAMDVDLNRAIVLIEVKKKADAPIHHYENLEVTKGVGRFGPFIKWNGMFINVNRKYNYDTLSATDIEELIEAKKQKEIDKLIINWEEEGIRIEKARWGRHNIIKGKQKLELAKTVDVNKITLEKAIKLLEDAKPKRKTTKKKTNPKKKTTKKK